jgi:exonuclease VII small subunit
MMTDETCCGACGYPIHATKESACDWCRQTADRIEALTAKLAEAEAKLAKAMELLKEARQDLEEYVTHEWPKDEHPVYERKWERDMELCRRIDATLAEIEGEKG